jgi:hypothetical protein
MKLNDFFNVKSCGYICFFTLLVAKTVDFHGNLVKLKASNAPTNSTIQSWSKLFPEGRPSIEDESVVPPYIACQ